MVVKLSVSEELKIIIHKTFCIEKGVYGKLAQAKRFLGGCDLNSKTIHNGFVGCCKKVNFIGNSHRLGDLIAVVRRKMQPLMGCWRLGRKGVELYQLGNIRWSDLGMSFTHFNTTSLGYYFQWFLRTRIVQFINANDLSCDRFNT